MSKTNKNELEKINKKINDTICYDIIDKLEDHNLIDIYSEQNSVKKNIETLKNILNKHVPQDISSNIIKEYTTHLIPAGTKGVIRGIFFNKYIKEKLEDILNRVPNNLELKFEKEHEKFPTDEIPDWYLYDKQTNKIILGFNQLDLWNGGHQTNRGSKYILDENKHTKNQKTLCVICNDIKIKSTKNKPYKFFNIGFEKDRLCYTNGLEDVIIKYFDIDDDILELEKYIENLQL
jgi:hypothetical protein